MKSAFVFLAVMASVMSFVVAEQVDPAVDVHARMLRGMEDAEAPIIDEPQESDAIAMPPQEEFKDTEWYGRGGRYGGHYGGGYGGRYGGGYGGRYGGGYGGRYRGRYGGGYGGRYGGGYGRGRWEEAP
ncbi:hypothetical protein Poli38472_011541 [Pythium oligandrum]|uniref:Glycine-rich protein n=1 Tax=Pythium oligandrum TaxID=41045 RepID=A0A8K1CL11_PYTOL|nr:hypothetical protein Poli38472_011541 [Pythium oligandrum]|eukprot:TMW64661.1 hypothetical protein Poli38472_011541 [Pythium oligandrum]